MPFVYVSLWIDLTKVSIEKEGSSCHWHALLDIKSKKSKRIDIETGNRPTVKEEVF